MVRSSSINGNYGMSIYENEKLAIFVQCLVTSLEKVQDNTHSCCGIWITNTFIVRYLWNGSTRDVV